MRSIIDEALLTVKRLYDEYNTGRSSTVFIPRGIF
jgi:hypothetical protein